MSEFNQERIADLTKGFLSMGKKEAQDREAESRRQKAAEERFYSRAEEFAQLMHRSGIRALELKYLKLESIVDGYDEVFKPLGVNAWPLNEKYVLLEEKRKLRYSSEPTWVPVETEVDRYYNAEKRNKYPIVSGMEDRSSYYRRTVKFGEYAVAKFNKGDLYPSQTVFDELDEPKIWEESIALLHAGYGKNGTQPKVDAELERINRYI